MNNEEITAGENGEGLRDRARRAPRRFKGNWLELARFVNIVQERKAFRQWGFPSKVTLNSLLQLAWAAVLGRLSGREEVLLGITVSGRPPELPGVERMVGLFINALPVPFAVNDRKTAREQLRDLHRLIQEVNAHGFLSLSEIRELTRLPPGTPLFYSLFLFENYPDSRSGDGHPPGGPPAVKEVRFREKTNFPLTLVVVPGRRLFLRLSGDGDCFGGRELERIAGGLERALEWIIRHPEAPLARAEIGPASERELVLERWSRNPVDYPEGGTLAGLFEEAAGKHPELPALTFRGESLTYRELDRRAGAVARALRERYSSLRDGELPPDTLVGICAERGPEMISGILGTLKAGAAYVPLDPEYPPARIRFLVKDGALPLILVQEKFSTLIGEALAGTGAEAVFLEEAARSAPAPPVPRKPSDLAYAIYTSGSTGLPKAVPVEHRGAVNLVRWMKTEYPLLPGEAVLQLASFTFDVSVAEIFWALSSGARLVPAEPGGAGTPGTSSGRSGRSGWPRPVSPPRFSASFWPRPGKRGRRPC